MLLKIVFYCYLYLASFTTHLFIHRNR